jgi:hypothetical protein
LSSQRRFALSLHARTVNGMDDDALSQNSVVAPCGCEWDGHCPHCGSWAFGGDAWEPRHTLACHRAAARAAAVALNPSVEPGHIDDRF